MNVGIAKKTEKERAKYTEKNATLSFEFYQTHRINMSPILLHVHPIHITHPILFSVQTSAESGCHSRAPSPMAARATTKCSTTRNRPLPTGLDDNDDHDDEGGDVI